MASLDEKISELESLTPVADDDLVVVVDISDTTMSASGTTKKALKSELKGDKGETGDNATVDAGTTTTLAAGQNATVTNVGTTSDAIFDFAIPQGIQGITGATGAKVTSVAFSGNDMVFVLDDASTITLTNAKTDLKGDTGAKIVSASFVGDDLVFTLDDSSTATVTGALTSLKGDQGDPGDAATIAVGTVTTVANNIPASVTNSGTSAAAVFDFEIPKGTDGTGSGDISGSGTANELAYFTAEKTIDNLPVATYPSLTEVSYVKGVTSAIQTQLNGKQASGSYEVTSNKETSALDTSTTKYPCNNVVKSAVDGKMSNPMSATGDIIYGGASGVATRLAKGDDGQILELESGAPAWKTKGVTPINAQTGNYTLVLSDTGKLITLTSSSAITLTIPTNASVAFPIGTQIDLSQMGDGKVTFAGTGVTINSKGGNKAIADKFVGVSLIKTGTNTWLLVGDLIA